MALSDSPITNQQISAGQVLSSAPSKTNGKTPRPRLGLISFVNSLPFVLPIQRGNVELDCHIEIANPNELNKQYESGNIDIGWMSAYYFLSKTNLEILSNVSISANGPVGSVLFFSKVDPSKLEGKTIVTPSCSATSVNMLKVLLIEQLNIRPNFITSDNPDINDPKVDACLVIGDQALLVDTQWSNKCWRADIASWWKARFGLPAVFGVMAATKSFAQRDPKSLQIISTKMSEAIDLGLDTLLPLVVKEAGRRTNLDFDRLHRYYLEELDYKFGADHKESLKVYRSLCESYGLMRQPVSNQDFSKLQLDAV